MNLFYIHISLQKRLFTHAHKENSNKFKIKKVTSTKYNIKVLKARKLQWNKSRIDLSDLFDDENVHLILNPYFHNEKEIESIWIWIGSAIVIKIEKVKCKVLRNW